IRVRLIRGRAQSPANPSLSVLAETGRTRSVPREERCREVPRVTTDAPAEDYLDLSGAGRVHLFRSGAGEPVLFLHAAGGAGTWPEFHARLADSFDVIAPDHPGFGKSDDFPEVDDITDLVYHYLDVLDGLGLETVHFV